MKSPRNKHFGMTDPKVIASANASDPLSAEEFAAMNDAAFSAWWDIAEAVASSDEEARWIFSARCVSERERACEAV